MKKPKNEELINNIKATIITPMVIIIVIMSEGMKKIKERGELVDAD